MERRRQFETEVRDDDWARETEMALRDHLLSAMPDEVLVTVVECKTTTCEVTFEAVDLTAALVRIGEPESYPPGVIDIVLGGIESARAQRMRVIVNVER